MSKILIPIEFDTNELLEEVQEIKKLADELGRKVYRFSVKASAKNPAPSEIQEEAGNN